MQVILNPYNIFYETGFKASFGLLLIKGEEKILFTDPRYKLKAEALAEKNAFRVELWSPEKFKTFLSGQKVSYEADFIKVQQLENWRKLVPDASWEASLEPIEKKRRYKTEKEIAIMKKSQEKNEIILKKALSFLKEGVSEIQFQHHLKILSLEEAISEQAFEPIVAFGENSAIPHHESGNRKIQKGDAILIDMGQKWEHYASDMTRCFFWKSCSTRQAEIYEKVLNIQEQAIEKMQIGQNIAELEKNLREKLGTLEKHFSHRLGHGIGLEVHESLGEIFEAGMVSTVEPGLYFDHEFGIRIEDLGCLRKEGFENFTKFPKDLCIL